MTGKPAVGLEKGGEAGLCIGSRAKTGLELLWSRPRMGIALEAKFLP